MGCLPLLLSILTFAVLWLTPVSPPDQAISPMLETEVNLQRYADLPQGRTADGAFILGADDAPVTLVVFEDFLCPHCQVFHPTIAELVRQYVAAGAARYEVRILATAGGERTRQLARLLECAAEQRPAAFWEGYILSYDLTLNDRFPTTDSRVIDLYAERLDLNAAALRDCLPTALQLELDLALADDLGATGTPAVYLRYADGTVVVYNGDRSLADLSAVIEAAKNGSPASRQNDA